MDYSRIEKYINAIEPIAKGERNDGTYNAGLCLRGTLGLHGDVLETVLQEFNRTKCIPPLPERDVTRIAKSVNESNVPLGDSDNTFERNGQKSRKTKSKQQFAYTVSASADTVSVDIFLSKEVSFYPNCQTNKPSGTTTIIQFLDDCKGGKYREQCAIIRAEADEDKRKELKKKLLPAITPNANPQVLRNNVACEEAGRSGIVCLDLDDIPVAELELARAKIAALPYVLAIGLSASGNGLFVLIACDEMPDLKTLIDAIQADFPYKIDSSRSDVCGLRFATLDVDLFIKSGEVSPAILVECQESADDVGGIEPLQHDSSPVDCLPLVLKDFVVAGAKSLNVVPAYFVALILPIVASVIGSRYVLVVKDDWLIPAILWIALVADSGGGKSPALAALLEPLEKLQKIASGRFGNQMQMFENEQQIYEVDLATWRANRKGKNGDKVTEPPLRPRAPQLKEYFVEDATTEALFEVLANNDDGILSAHDELAGFFGSFDAYRHGSSKDESVYNRFYDGRYAKTNRKSGDKKVIEANHTHTSIGGGIQFELLQEFVSKKPRVLYSGLFARFSFVMPPDTGGGFSDSTIPEPVKTAYYTLFDTILAWRKHEMVMSPDSPYRIEMTAEAKKAFVKNYDYFDAIRVLPETPGVLKSILSKMKETTGRMALVLHIAEYASRYPDGTFSGTIPPVEKETMDNAVRLSRWLLNQTRHVLRLICPQLNFYSDREAVAILGAIHKHGETTKEDLHKLQIFKKAVEPAKAIDAKLSKLRSRGVIESVFVKNPEGGRGKEVYRFPMRGGGSVTPEIPDENAGSTSTSSVSVSANMTTTQSDVEDEVGSGTTKIPEEFDGSTSTSNEFVSTGASAPQLKVEEEFGSETIENPGENGGSTSTSNESELENDVKPVEPGAGLTDEFDPARFRNMTIAEYEALYGCGSATIKIPEKHEGSTSSTPADGVGDGQHRTYESRQKICCGISTPEEIAAVLAGF